MQTLFTFAHELDGTVREYRELNETFAVARFEGDDKCSYWCAAIGKETDGTFTFGCTPKLIAEDIARKTFTGMVNKCIECIDDDKPLTV